MERGEDSPARRTPASGHTVQRGTNGRSADVSEKGGRGSEAMREKGLAQVREESEDLIREEDSGGFVSSEGLWGQRL